MYVIDMPSFTREAFYQAAVLGFGSFAPINLTPPCPALQLLRCVLDAPEAVCHASCACASRAKRDVSLAGVEAGGREQG